MSGGGGSSPQQTSEPWDEQAPYLEQLFRSAEQDILDRDTANQYGEISGRQRRNYVDDTTGVDVYDRGQLAGMGLDAAATRTAVESGGFVPFTDAEQQAQQGALDLAGRGVDPYLTGAQSNLANNAGLGYLEEGASGAFLTPDTNPYLADAVRAAQDPLIERFQGDILPAVTGQFGGSGNFGSSMHQYAVNRATDDFTQNLADAATGAYANAYQAERGNQLAAQNALTSGIQNNAALTPTLAAAARQQELGNLGLLEGIGGAQAAKAQELGLMNADQFNARQNDDVSRLQQYAQLIQGTPVVTTGTTGGGGTNQFAGALGGAATGAALGTAVAPGFGTAIGAGIGGLGGLFF